MKKKKKELVLFPPARPFKGWVNPMTIFQSNVEQWHYLTEHPQHTHTFLNKDRVSP